MLYLFVLSRFRTEFPSVSVVETVTHFILEPLRPMCTLSFLPRRFGFLLAMNRDEQKTRPRALAPSRHWTGTHRALFPSEPGGGTWIGVNDAGLSLALINWYAKPQQDRAPERFQEKCVAVFRSEPRKNKETEGFRDSVKHENALCVSRGIIIPHLLAADDMTDFGAMLADLPLSKTNPFRLIGVSAKDRSLQEWRWDGKALACRRFGWTRRHWFSSGHDEALANRKRAALARAIPVLTPARLRRLHASHEPVQGPFSICMHRHDAQTVSYTEIAVSGPGVQMRYVAGPPCRKKPGTPHAMSFTRENRPR